MQTRLPESFLDTSAGQEAEAILRKCVHCGFCNATCPTYQLLGDEADGPRGRIYQIKEMLEDAPAAQLTQKHLDRCLLCRACETTCPSGVNYSRLFEIGQLFQQPSARSVVDRFKRYCIQAVLPYPSRLRLLLGITMTLKLFIPERIRRQLPVISNTQSWPVSRHRRKVIVHEGCVQSVVEADVNIATAKVLDAVGISVIRTSPVRCCGALHHHLSFAEKARKLARENIDQWWPYLEAGAEAIVSNASGCGVMIKDYLHLLKGDVDYAEKARIVVQSVCDVSEVLSQETLPLADMSHRRVVFQSPCSLQHGLQLAGQVEKLLLDYGVNLVTPVNPHLCCGSAGSYSMLQAEISNQLLKDKLEALHECQSGLILTANIGCLLHVRKATDLPVMHWIEFIAGKLSSVGKFSH